jgi:hypothetical protein
MRRVSGASRARCVCAINIWTRLATGHEKTSRERPQKRLCRCPSAIEAFGAAFAPFAPRCSMRLLMIVWLLSSCLSSTRMLALPAEGDDAAPPPAQDATDDPALPGQSAGAPPTVQDQPGESAHLSSPSPDAPIPRAQLWTVHNASPACLRASHHVRKGRT